jgi:hypothetical protein
MAHAEVAMADEKARSRAISVGLLMMFPPVLREAALDDRKFRQALGLNLNAVINLSAGGLSFDRSALFSAVRKLLSGETKSCDIVAQDSSHWNIGFKEGKDQLAVSREDKVYEMPDFSFLSPDRDYRLSWFDCESKKYEWNDERSRSWRDILNARPIEDEEVDQLLGELRLTPLFVAGSVAKHLRDGGTIDVVSLVPDDIRYYERLAGQPGGAADLKSFIDKTGAARIHEWLRNNPYEGVRRSLLLASHQFLVQSIDLTVLPENDVLRLYDWLCAKGDRISQLGAIECGLAHLDRFAGLAPYLVRLVQAFLDDRPDDEEGRLKLLFSLIVFVEGEIARTGIARDLPPFWRRLASIAHASILERHIIAAGIPAAFMIDFSVKARGQLYYSQSFIDLRREPRWLPEFVLPGQLKAECVGRIAFAATTNDRKIQNAQLRAQLLEPDGGLIRPQLVFPFSSLPGPLEGGTESVIEMPTEIQAHLLTDLEADPLTARSFTGLVSSAFLFRIGPQLADLAAKGLRRTKYQLRQISDQGDPFSLLMGLASVAAVTRNPGLAEEVRILVRVVRRRPGVEIEPDNAMRIALVAAAAFQDSTNWCRFVGEWLTELAFEDMTLEKAETMLAHIHILCQLEPLLWETCGRAEAALSAFGKSIAAA